MSENGLIMPKQMAQIYRNNLGKKVAIIVVERIMAGHKEGTETHSYWKEVRGNL
jgi:hypothetical protein